MKSVKILSVAAALSAAFVSMGAQAGVSYDAHGNVGYDTAAECDAAVLSGNAKFYESHTHKPALKRAGEKSVEVATLRNLGPRYERGACDLGVGRAFNRDGVAKALQGKYVPYSPDMPINVYRDAAGKPVRVAMKQCDNRFSDAAPRPVEIPAPRPAPQPQPEPVVVEEAPVPAPVAEPSKPAVRPYLFGTIGALQDGVKYTTGNSEYSDSSTRVAGQVGAGVQLGKYFGAEAFYQGSGKHEYEFYQGNTTNENTGNRNQAYGARLTVGTDADAKARVFAKAGVARVRNSLSNIDGKKNQTRPTAGIGFNYNFNDNVSLRADYDHYFKRSSNIEGLKRKGSNYLGAGVQYTF